MIALGRQGLADVNKQQLNKKHKICNFETAKFTMQH